MNHYYALRQLMPIDLGTVDDGDMMVEGALMDSAMMTIMSVLPEFFPSTVDALLARWEAEYGVIPRLGASPADRRRELLAKYISTGNQTRGYFVALAATLGYEIQITEFDGDMIFRAGISKAGDLVYAAVSMWVWKVTTLNKPPAGDLIDLFRDLNPPHMRLVFEFNS